MGAFIRRHAVLILFVVVIIGLGGAFRRTSQLITDNKKLSVTTHELTLQLEATVKQRRIEICEGEASTREDLKILLLRIADFIPQARHDEFTQHVLDALDPPPDNCPPS